MEPKESPGPSSRETALPLEGILSDFPPLDLAHLSSIYFISFFIRLAFLPPAIWKRETNVLYAAKLTDVDKLNANGKCSALRRFSPDNSAKCWVRGIEPLPGASCILEEERL